MPPEERIKVLRALREEKRRQLLEEEHRLREEISLADELIEETEERVEEELSDELEQIVGGEEGDSLEEVVGGAAPPEEEVDTGYTTGPTYAQPSEPYEEKRRHDPRIGEPQDRLYEPPEREVRRKRTDYLSHDLHKRVENFLDDIYQR